MPALDHHPNIDPEMPIDSQTNKEEQTMNTTHQDGLAARSCPNTQPLAAACIVPTPYTVFEAERFDTPGLSNFGEVIWWCIEQGYDFSVIQRDPEDETIPHELWPYSLVFDEVQEAIYFRIRWIGDMWVYQD